MTTTPQPVTRDGWTLTTESGEPVLIGHAVTDRHGNKTTVTGGRPPAGPGKSGYVWTEAAGEFYPHVFGLRWTSPEGRYFGDGKGAL